jgi:hypothetical protein
MKSRFHLVATIGLRGSASTWVFNVVRELMVASFGESDVFALFADQIDELPAHPKLSDRHIVIKSHRGSAALEVWLRVGQSKAILSVRDPRDASISMSQRFNAPLMTAARWVANDCNRIKSLSRHFPLLRFEDRFFNDRETVRRLAGLLQLDPDSGMIDSIFARYSTEAVRCLANRLSDNGLAMDPVTQIHKRHIGDVRSGKWKDLPELVQAKLNDLFHPFLEQYGYL